MYTPESGIKAYEELPLQDSEEFELRPYLDRAHGFLDFSRQRSGKVNVHVHANFSITHVT